MIVKIYSTPTCPWCKVTKEYFKDRNISFEEIDVASDQEAAKELLDKSGQLGVPVTEIDGVIIIGFDKEAIDQALSADEARSVESYLRPLVDENAGGPFRSADAYISAMKPAP